MSSGVLSYPARSPYPMVTYFGMSSPFLILSASTTSVEMFDSRIEVARLRTFNRGREERRVILDKVEGHPPDRAGS